MIINNMRTAFLASCLILANLLSASAQTDPAAPQAPAPTTQASPQPVKVEPAVLLVLIRSTLIALDQANKTGNYSVLRDLGSPDFALNNSSARLAEIFASQRAQNLDMSSVLLVEPQITLQPQREANGMLHIAGFYPASGDSQLKFELLFQSVGNQLRLFGLSVNYVDPKAASPAGTAAQPADNAPAPAKPAAAPSAKPKPEPSKKPRAKVATPADPVPQ